MTDVQQTISTPSNATELANSLAKFAGDAIKAKKDGLTGAALIAAIGEAAIADLAGALHAAGGVGGELGSEGLGVAEAFAIAGFSVARSLTGK